MSYIWRVAAGLRKNMWNLRNECHVNLNTEHIEFAYSEMFTYFLTASGAETRSTGFKSLLAEALMTMPHAKQLHYIVLAEAYATRQMHTDSLILAAPPVDLSVPSCPAVDLTNMGPAWLIAFWHEAQEV